MQRICGKNQTTEGLGDQEPGPAGKPSKLLYIKSSRAKQPVALAYWVSIPYAVCGQLRPDLGNRTPVPCAVP